MASTSLTGTSLQAAGVDAMDGVPGNERIFRNGWEVAVSPFEFAFALFGLLLGLCIAEVFGGLGRAFEARKTCSIGWLTPLLAIFVLIDLLSVWSGLWETRSHIPMNPLVLIGGALWAGAYYLAVYVIFPRELPAGCDLDVHFFGVRRLVLGISVTTAILIILNEVLITGIATAQSLIVTAAMLAPPFLIAAFAKTKLWAGGSLVVLILIYLESAIMHAVGLAD
jgi:hypothetical protein